MLMIMSVIFFGIFAIVVILLFCRIRNSKFKRSLRGKETIYLIFSLFKNTYAEFYYSSNDDNANEK